MMLYYITAS